MTKISKSVIRQLCKACSDKNVGVREIALHTLGCIGMPDVQIAIPTITKCLKDKDS